LCKTLTQERVIILVFLLFKSPRLTADVAKFHCLRHVLQPAPAVVRQQKRLLVFLFLVLSLDPQGGDTDEEAEDETVTRTDEGDNDNNDCDRRHGQQTNVTGYTDTKRRWQDTRTPNDLSIHQLVPQLTCDPRTPKTMLRSLATRNSGGHSCQKQLCWGDRVAGTRN